MIARQANSDQTHTVAKRPVITAVRTGEKIKPTPSTMSNYAYEILLVRVHAIDANRAIVSD